MYVFGHVPGVFISFSSLIFSPAQLNSQISDARAAAERAEAILSQTFDLKLEQTDSSKLVMPPVGEGNVEDETVESGEVGAVALAMVPSQLVADASGLESAEDLRISQRRSAMRAIVQKLHEQENNIKMM